MARSNENYRKAKARPRTTRATRATYQQPQVVRKKPESKAKKIISNFILIVALGVFCFSAFKLYEIFSEYKAAENEYKAAEQEGPQKKDNVEQPPNFALLQKTNKDIVGWIKIEGTKINYPLVKGPDNDFYLNRTYKKTYNSAGSIFLDYNNASGFTDPNTIIYGHNMKNGTMFADLRHFMSSDFVKTHKNVIIYTPKYKLTYEIFTGYITKADSDTYTLFNTFGTNYFNYVEKMKSRSNFYNNLPFKGKDKMITLSTCTNATGDKRTVIQAKLVKIEKLAALMPAQAQS